MHPDCIYNGVCKCYKHASKAFKTGKNVKIQRTGSAIEESQKQLQKPPGFNCKSEEGKGIKGASYVQTKNEDNADGSHETGRTSDNTNVLDLLKDYKSDDNDDDAGRIKSVLPVKMINIKTSQTDNHVIYDTDTWVDFLDLDDEKIDEVEGGITWDRSVPVIDREKLVVHDSDKTYNHHPVGEGLFLKKGCTLQNKQRIAQFIGDEEQPPDMRKLTIKESEYAITLRPTTILQCRKYAENGNIFHR